jgi:putative endopeptidase
MKAEIGESLVGEMYASAMDQEAIDAAGIAPIEDLLTAIGQLTDYRSVTRFATSLIKEGTEAFVFGTSVMPDFKNSSMNTLLVHQAGLGLPSKDYYSDESKKEYVEKLRNYIKTTFVLIGDDEADALVKANQVIEFETKLAEFTLSPMQLRDLEKLYNPMTVEELEALAPHLSAIEVFKTLGLENPKFLVHNVDYFKLASELVGSTSLDTLRNYLTYKVIFAYSPYLAENFQKEHFEFAKKGLRGQPKEVPQWELRITQISPLLPDELSRVYVEKHFSEKSKAACLEMIGFILKEFEERIKQLAWLSDPTKEKALLKLSKFGSKIGYPDVWKTYDLLKGLILRTNAYCKNIRYAKSFDFDLKLKKYGQPVDKTEWAMPASAVNAYYHPLNNEIAFPAGILQPPFFYGATDEAPHGFPALNFGGIGAVISHEISHGFDDQGSIFDHNGNMANWWTEDDKQEFKRRRGKIVDQFNQYRVHGQSVNGDLCQGENIADLGGVSIAFSAFKKFMAAHPERLIPHPKFTQEQQFFISFGSIWRGLVRKDMAITLLNTDPHSPLEFRTDGPLANVSEFHEAFGVRPGDRMYNPEETRVEIW